MEAKKQIKSARKKPQQGKALMSHFISMRTDRGESLKMFFIFTTALNKKKFLEMKKEKNLSSLFSG